jgi:hypothetical protein
LYPVARQNIAGNHGLGISTCRGRIGFGCH